MSTRPLNAAASTAMVGVTTKDPIYNDPSAHR
jgi:hypothetical protein